MLQIKSEHAYNVIYFSANMNEGASISISVNTEIDNFKIDLLSEEGSVVDNTLVTLSFLKENNNNGFIIHEMGNGDWCFEINYDNSERQFDQILFGSGNNHGKLDVLKVDLPLTICRNEIDVCSEYTDCEKCLQNGCGWCSTTQTCLIGNEAGPEDGSSCPSWHKLHEGEPLTLDIEYNFPFSPINSNFTWKSSKDVYIPMSYYVNLQAPIDLVIVTTSGITASKLIEAYEVYLNEYFKNINEQYNFHISLISFIYTYREMFSLNDYNSDLFLEALMELANDDREDHQLLIALSETSINVRWRENSRRIILILGNKPSSDEQDIKDTLIEHSIYPIISVPQNSAGFFQSFVEDKLKFGLVESNNEFRSAIQSVLSSASILPYHFTNPEYNEQLWSITGLDPLRMNAKFIFEVRESEDDEIYIPGFGVSRIRFKPNEPVEINDISLHMTQEIELFEIDFSHLRPIIVSEQLFLYISIDFQFKGKLYLLTQDEKYEEISSDGWNFVDKENLKVFYNPIEGGYSICDEPYTSFKYRLVSSCIDIDANVNIIVPFVNKKPSTSFTVGEAKENRMILLTLDGRDEFGHELEATIESADGMRLFQYNECLELQLGNNDIYRDVDLDDILVQCSSTEIIDKPAKVSSFKKIIYIPSIYQNSEGKPPQYKFSPKIKYHVTQKKAIFEGCQYELLSSDSIEYSFDIEWVNQPPTVTDYDNLTLENECTYTEPCEFYQNLGVYYPNEPDFVSIYVIAKDIEDENLYIEILSITCSLDIILIDIEGKDLKDGQCFEVRSNVWEELFKFVPGENEVGDCKIKYKAVDKDGLDSNDDAEITIKILPLNQPPISNNKIVYFSEKIDFTISVKDIDSDNVDIILKNCQIDKSNDFVLILNDITIDCESTDLLIGQPVEIDNENRIGAYSEHISCDSCKRNHKIGTIELFYDDREDREYDYRYTIDLYYIQIQDIDGIDCEDDSCIVSGEVTLKETYYVTTHLKIDRDSIISIDPKTLVAIINLSDSPIEIDGGRFVIVIDTLEEYNEFVEEIKTNTSFEYIIISGKYDGKFDNIEIKSPPDTEGCELISPKTVERKNSLNLLFSIDSSDCSDPSSKFPWWGILLITIGVVVVLSLVALFILRKRLMNSRKM